MFGTHEMESEGRHEKNEAQITALISWLVLVL